ncbi:beta-lactamase family protein [Streptomyces sp. NBC_01210]|uniref:serine hydrolase domain-containing protein n=1 Tax=Streptomyces sp. NBC_01210 TaxID=2903774 RepID=UPI002E12A58F|nr:beta-lactamase family protein [Streptomyces sp. NBC_01210]
MGAVLMAGLSLRPVPVCVLSGSAPPLARHGHDPAAFVEIGSLTKVLTGTLLIRMVRAGLLGLDDAVEQWLPTPPGSGITLGKLADHTSGLPRLPPGLNGRDPYAAFDENALGTVLGRLGEIAVRQPGQEEEYSNLGYAVLGAALVSAAGRPYEELVREHVLTPLGVDEVTAHPPADRLLGARNLFGRERARWTMDGPILPAGGLWATPRALATVVTRLLLECSLGEPAPSWQSAGPLLWHNGATRDASAFTGVLPQTGNWVLVHRLGGSPGRTDKIGLGLLAAAGNASGQGAGSDRRRSP